MKKLSRMKRLVALVGGLSLLGACGGTEEEVQESERVVTAAACQDHVKQFTSCVHQMNLNGVATCAATEVRTHYEVFAWCSSSTAKAVRWTCCPQ